MKKTLFGLLFLFMIASANAQLKSPAEFLPNYGKQISQYHKVEAYFGQLLMESPNIKKQKYGVTNEGRDLNVYFISSPENLANLDLIRNNNLAAIGLSDTKTEKIGDKLIVWLSFNVHGNEFAGTESAMTVAYELVNPINSVSKKELENTIVILDPCINPDGYSRYGNWLREISGKKTHPELSDREHMEVWPGGRYNHYIFDLNRDWAWQTQVESKQRLALYNDFFPPSAEPWHEYIEKYQKDFHNTLGSKIAQKFDAENWLYNTRERFDMFYPSYGDTYPTYNGAVGMTFEQGGIGAGREILMENGSTLTIKDRLTHHAKAVLTAVEVATSESEKLIEGFRNFMTISRKNIKGDYRTYVLKSNPKLEQMAVLLKKNKIEFAYADASQKANGFNYQTQNSQRFTIEPNDLIVKVDQPKAILTQVLFEPKQVLNDSLSYDITAWALPLAYGVEAYALKSTIAIKTKTSVEIVAPILPKSVYGFYIPWNNRISAQILSLLHQKNIKVRSAMKKAIFDNVVVEPGGLIVSKADNSNVPDFEKTVSEIIMVKKDFNFITSGYTKNGADLGGENFTILKAPKIALLSGKGVGSTEFGAVWFYLDEVVGYPVSIVETGNFDRLELTKYNTLILADGYYDFSEEQQTEITEWVKNGGKVIAMNNALSVFEDKEAYSLSLFESDEAKKSSEKQASDKLLKERFLDYQSSERRAISASIPGAVIENVLDITHPMSFGLGPVYYSLKTDDKHYSLLKNATNLAYVPLNYKSYGFVGHDIKNKLNNTVSFAIDKKEKGKVIYMIDNPLFRGFWENGNLLFSNALFLVN
jgi:hypothetical protein